VVDLDAAFGQQLLHVAVRQPEAQLPADREHDHIGREAEASEGRPCESGGAGTASSHGGSLPAPDSITAAATVLGDPSAYLPYRARALTNLGIQLARVGERRGALHTTGEAAGIYAQLAEARPAAYLPSLASVLTNYGTALAGVGDTRAALKATRKAVQIRRRLAEVDPATHPPELARARQRSRRYVLPRAWRWMRLGQPPMRPSPSFKNSQGSCQRCSSALSAPRTA
jgi:hypothetical protein